MQIIVNIIFLLMIIFVVFLAGAYLGMRFIMEKFMCKECLIKMAMKEVNND